MVDEVVSTRCIGKDEKVKSRLVKFVVIVLSDRIIVWFTGSATLIPYQRKSLLGTNVQAAALLRRLLFSVSDDICHLLFSSYSQDGMQQISG